MKILSIETSCDETAIALLSVIDSHNPTFTVEAHIVASQIELHKQYGGVFPIMAKREHAKNITHVLMETLEHAHVLIAATTRIDSATEEKIVAVLAREDNLADVFLNFIRSHEKPTIDRIAVTVGPGLAPALWVGISFAKALSIAWDIPLVPVNHMEGHILSIFPNKDGKEFTISNVQFPMLSLLVSGGHTELILVKNIGEYSLIGQTRDDAAGEAFDKVARMLGLPYPGGPEISKLAALFRASGKPKTIELPRPMIHSKDFDFSFSGLKTSVLYLIRDMPASLGSGDISDDIKMEIAAEFEDAVVEVLATKTIRAAQDYGATSIIVGGGVAANQELRTQLTEQAANIGLAVVFPTKELSTDNAVMIGITGYYGTEVPINSDKLIAQGNMAL